MSKPTKFAIGRRWRCVRGAAEGRPRFWFVIVGPGQDWIGKPSKRYKLCRIEVFPEDMHKQRHSHGAQAHYSHAHLRRVATLDPAE